MKEINEFGAIEQILKIHFRIINKLDSNAPVTRQDIANVLGLKAVNIGNYIHKRQTPHSKIIEFCKKYDINVVDIYFKEFKPLCVDCKIELNENNMSKYTSRKKKITYRAMCITCFRERNKLYARVRTAKKKALENE